MRQALLGSAVGEGMETGATRFPRGPTSLLVAIFVAAAVAAAVWTGPPLFNAPASVQTSLAARAPASGRGSCGVPHTPDCDHADNGSCGNACCAAEVEAPGSAAAAYAALSAYLERGGGDGLYAKAPDTDPA